MNHLKILVVDDHPLIRKGFESILKGLNFDTPSVNASDGFEAIALMKTKKFDFVFMDIHMPKMSGIEATKEIRALDKSIKIVGISAYSEIDLISKLFKAGANGFTDKTIDSKELYQLIQSVYSGNIYLPKSIKDELLEFDAKHTSTSNAEIKFTLKQKNILNLICNQFSSKEIALILNIANKTVEWHRANLFKLTNSKNVAGLIKYAFKKGIL